MLYSSKYFLREFFIDFLNIFFVIIHDRTVYCVQYPTATDYREGVFFFFYRNDIYIS